MSVLGRNFLMLLHILKLLQIRFRILCLHGTVVTVCAARLKAQLKENIQGNSFAVFFSPMIYSLHCMYFVASVNSVYSVYSAYFLF